MPSASSGPPARPLRLLTGLSEIAAGYELVLCDVWGVVHDGETAHRGAVDALLRFRAGGGRVVLITNAPNPAANVRKRIDALNVPREAYDAIVSSGDIAVSLILERGDVGLLHVGPPRELALYREVAARRGTEPRLTGAAEAGLVVCIGLADPFNEDPADYDSRLQDWRARDLDLICANPDLVVQVGPRLMYCAGSIADRYEKLGGTVIHAGKPHPRIYARALAVGGGLLGHAPDRGKVLAIGDAMRTDICGAHNEGLDSLFVLSGIHGEAYFNGPGGALDGAALDQFIAAAGLQPTAAIGDLVW
jgi:HAD superfamily hydrolase (TIGR01459 family)